jgi:ATP-dependent Clp protease ATP-binding subunit ClpA
MGFHTNETGRGKGRGAIERTFSPEFRNRLDAWIAFNALDFESIERVVDKLIKEVNAQINEKNVSVSLTEDARAWLARRGYDRAMGARPMSRLIQQKIREPLAEELLFGNSLESGGEVSVELKDDEIVLVFPSSS